MDKPDERLQKGRESRLWLICIAVVAVALCVGAVWCVKKKGNGRRECTSVPSRTQCIYHIEYRGGGETKDWKQVLPHPGLIAKSPISTKSGS